MTTVSQVTKSLGVSTRMLRYYEQTGLIESSRRDDYAYRIYDETAITRLKQILILRRLRIPIKQIRVILDNEDAAAATEVFRQNIGELDAEITALSTIRSVLCRFLSELKKTSGIQIRSLIARDETLSADIESLPSVSIHAREDQSMEQQRTAEGSFMKASGVRILYLPPAAVAAAHYVGDDPEFHCSEILDDFVRRTNLCKIKPDLRHYGFNHPNPTDETGRHGYEMWATVPEDWEVPSPLEKKRFAGGLYAAHMIPMGNFSEWNDLIAWVRNSGKYTFAGDWLDQEHMCGLLEEHLNYIGHVYLENTEPEDMQLDLLIPVKERA